jgi:hypothetical protein
MTILTSLVNIVALFTSMRDFTWTWAMVKFDFGYLWLITQMAMGVAAGTKLAGEW